MNIICVLLRASWLSVIIALLTGAISGGACACLIALINGATSENSINKNLPWYFLGLVLIVLLTTILSQFLLVNLAQEAVYNLRLSLSRGILSSPLRHLEELGNNRLMATLIGDVQTLSETISVIPTFCSDIAIILGCLVYLSWLSALAFIISMVFIVVAITSIQLLLHKARKFLVLVREEEDRLFKHFRTITDGIKEFKLHAKRCQVFFSKELQPSVTASRYYNIAAMRTFALASGWGQLLFFSIVGFLLFALPQFVSIASPVLSAYILTFAYLMTPFRNILVRLPQFFRASVALEKVERMKLALASQKENMDTLAATEQRTQISDDSLFPDEITNFSHLSPYSPSSSWTLLEVDRVSHSYRGEQEDSTFVLGKLNLKFVPGQLVFIVGGNGSGKSTFAKIITGLYIPETGEIRLNSQPITDKNREWYRHHFSVVFSDFYLFERLVDTKHLLDTQVQEYLRQLNLDDKVKIKNGIFSTTALSQGQRKRLALLTVYLEDRPIYLFDEWASDQDPVFREIFYNEILVNLKQQGKTVLVISHDDRYFHLADRIIKLDYGKVEYDTSPFA